MQKQTVKGGSAPPSGKPGSKYDAGPCVALHCVP